MGALDDVRLSENNDPRCACILLLDTSGSMVGAPIDALNEGLRAFQQDIQLDDLAKRRVEIAIVTFGKDNVRIWEWDRGHIASVDGTHSMPLYQNAYWVEAGQFQAPVLDVGGGTPMGPAIERALDLLRERKTQYREYGIPFYRPWVFLITDGEPDSGWESAAARVQREDNEQAKGVAFFTVGVPPNANLRILARIAPPHRQPLMLNSVASFKQMFVWLSQSQGRVSAGEVGSQTTLPPIGWGSVDE